jgi:hypothetical protein
MLPECALHGGLVAHVCCHHQHVSARWGVAQQLGALQQAMGGAIGND